MSRVRIHIPPERWGAWILLESDEQRYLIDVLRSKAGRRIEIFDGRGRQSVGELSKEPNGWGMRLLPGDDSETGASSGRGQVPDVVLAVGMLKGKKFDEVVRMVTELGVSKVVPLMTERTVVRPSDDRMEPRLKRWRQIAADAARQSGRTRLPEIVAPCPLIGILQLVDTEAGVMLYEGAADMGLGAWVASTEDVRRRVVIVGPEGGFATEEVELAREKGFSIADLGPTVLRAQTAAIAAAVFACLDRGRLVE